MDAQGEILDSKHVRSARGGTSRSGRMTRIIILGILGATTVIYGSLEVKERWVASLGCHSDYISEVASELRRSAQRSASGMLDEATAIATMKSVVQRYNDLGSTFRCPNTGSLYDSVINTPDAYANGFIVWDSVPHGLLIEFRYVVTAEGSVTKLSESEFQKRVSSD